MQYHRKIPEAPYMTGQFRLFIRKRSSSTDRGQASFPR